MGSLAEIPFADFQVMEVPQSFFPSSYTLQV